MKTGDLVQCIISHNALRKRGITEFRVYTIRECLPSFSGNLGLRLVEVALPLDDTKQEFVIDAWRFKALKRFTVDDFIMENS